MKLFAVETPILLDTWYPDDSVEHISKIDQSPNQEFNYNANGYIRNNIAALMSVQNESVFAAAYSRLQETDNTSNLVETLSDSDNIRLILPKTYQDPVEFSRFVDYVSRFNEDLVKSEIENAPADKVEVNDNSEGSD